MDKRFEPLSPYKLANLWADLELAAWRLDKATKEQNTLDTYKFVDEIEHLRKRLQNHYIGKELAKS